MGVMSDAYLEIRELSRSFGSVEAVKGLSFSVGAGEIVGLLGPNGAGKSTTMKMLAGFLSPTAGDVMVRGRSIYAALPNWRRSIGAVLEDLFLMEYLSVREHLEFGGQLYGLSVAETNRRTSDLLQYLSLERQAETLVADASHGTRKKLSIALSLIHSPSFLVLDEALSGVDAVSRRDIRELLRNKVDRGSAVVLSSHELSDIESFVDRVLIIDEGRLAREERVADIVASGSSAEAVYIDTVRPHPVASLTWA